VRRRKYPDDVERSIEPEPITWSHFDRSGLVETIRTGHVWSPAPSIKGSRTYWVVPTDHVIGEPSVIAVTVISRRRQIGRAGSDRDRYRSNGGRVIDQGEAISEAHPDSPTGQMSALAMITPHQPRAITVQSLPSWLYKVLSSSA
jgi:hypothetical protein